MSIDTLGSCSEHVLRRPDDYGCRLQWQCTFAIVRSLGLRSGKEIAIWCGRWRRGGSRCILPARAFLKSMLIFLRPARIGNFSRNENEQEQEKSELPAATMKLIHSGKVLKDSQTIAECQLKPNAFLVVMVSKVSDSYESMSQLFI